MPETPALLSGASALAEARRLLAGAPGEAEPLLQQLARYRLGQSAQVPEVPPGTPLFGDLGPRAFEAMAKVLEVRVAAPGVAVVTEGEPARSLFGVAHGRLEVVRELEGGARKTVALLHEGKLFGEIGLIAGTPRLASVVAATPCVLLELTREALDAVTLRHAAVDATMQAFYRAQLLENVLQASPLFAPLSPAERVEVAKAFEPRTAAPGELLRRLGEVGDGLYLLLRGECTPFRPDTGPGKVTFSKMREGEVFGELSLLLGKPAQASVRVDTPSTLLWLSRAAFERLVLSNPALRAELMKLGFERLQTASKLLSGRLSHPGDARV
jgi:CRP-like cAMP-binding protein